MIEASKENTLIALRSFEDIAKMATENGLWLLKIQAAIKWVEKTDHWRPIETAPKDGTMLLLFDDELKLFGTGSYDNHGWDMSTQYGGQQHPTHWMPLPKPPEE